jgi:hypothetical protein
MFRKGNDRCCSISSLRLNNKGQVTIFIIIGIVILIVAGLAIVLLTEERSINEEVIPLEKVGVENYISICVAQLGEDALFYAGQQGGYVEVPNYISNDGSLHLKVAPHVVVPYWAYGINRDIPSLVTIQNDVDRYIEENLRECVYNLQPFKDRYDLVEKSEIKSQTEFTNDKVLFTVDWVIEIREKSGETVAEMLKHNTESKIKFKKLYETAVRIIDKEFETMKLEEITQDLISLEHPQVPLSGIDFTCKPKVWNVEEVQRELKNLLRINIKQLQIAGTDVMEYPEDLPYYKNHYVWDIGNAYYSKDVSVVFNFEDNYPFLFSVTPLSGGTMKSSEVGGTKYIPFLCLQNWKFTYNLMFPINVRLRDETTGYNFNIALMTHLVRNYPNRESAEYSQKSFHISKVTDDDYCQNKDVPMTIKTYEVVNNSKGVYYRQPLGGVETTFTCIGYQCPMGTTDYNLEMMGDVAQYTQNFPYCVGGILRANKEGYEETWQRVVTKEGQDVELNLRPLYEIPAQKIKVVKHNFKSSTDIGEATPLKDGEDVMINVYYNVNQTIKKLYGDNDYSDMVMINNNYQEDVLNLLAKADFDYYLEVLIVNNEEIVGGYQGNWSVNWQELSSANEIIFHTLTSQDQTELLLGMNYNSKFITKPELK